MNTLVDCFNTAFDRRLHGGKVGVAARVQTASLDELPESFDQIEIRRVTRQEQEVDAQRPGQRGHQMAMLVAGIIQHQRRGTMHRGGNLPQQVAHRFGVDGSAGRYRDELMGDGVEGAQHTESLPAAAGGHVQPHQAPQVAEKASINEMRGIDEEDRPRAPFGLPEPGFQPLIQKRLLGVRVGLGGQRAGFAPAQTESFFKNWRT